MNHPFWPLRIDESITYGYALLSLVKIFERTDSIRRGSAVCVILAVAAAFAAVTLARHERRRDEVSAAAADNGHDDDDTGDA